MEKCLECVIFSRLKRWLLTCITFCLILTTVTWGLFERRSRLVTHSHVWLGLSHMSFRVVRKYDIFWVLLWCTIFISMLKCPQKRFINYRGARQNKICLSDCASGWWITFTFFYRYCYWLKVINSRVISFFYSHLCCLPFPQQILLMNKTDLFREKILHSNRHLRFYLSGYKGTCVLIVFNIKTAPMFVSYPSSCSTVSDMCVPSSSCWMIHCPLGNQNSFWPEIVTVFTHSPLFIIPSIQIMVIHIPGSLTTREANSFHVLFVC